MRDVAMLPIHLIETYARLFGPGTCCLDKSEKNSGSFSLIAVAHAKFLSIRYFNVRPRFIGWVLVDGLYP